MHTTLETERLWLRRFREEDAPALFALRSDPEIAQWMGTPQPWPSLEYTRMRIAEWNDDAAECSAKVGASEDETPAKPGCLGDFALWPKGMHAIVGCATLAPTPSGNVHDVQLGYYLAASHRGHGYVREACMALFERARADRRVHRIWINTMPTNEASIAVAKRLPLEDLGELEDPWYGSEALPTARFFCWRRSMASSAAP